MKFIMTADDDDVKIGTLRFDPGNQLKAVDKRHLDVGDDDVGMGLRHHLQRLFSVLGPAHDFKARFLPRKPCGKPLADNLLIINQDDS